jgi:hypothetical protein
MSPIWYTPHGDPADADLFDYGQIPSVATRTPFIAAKHALS